MTNTAANGVLPSRTGPFAINNSTFDYVGNALSSTSTLITLNGVTQSTITLNDVTYGNSRTNSKNYNYTILGSSTGLYWTNQNYSGQLTGDSNEQNDSGNHVIWQQGNTCQAMTSVQTNLWSSSQTWNTGFVPTSCNP